MKSFLPAASLLFLFLFLFLILNAQYKNDNKLFRTIYWDELCDALQKQDGHLVLDVRSKGEYEDTSSDLNFNLGRIKGAMNIDIRDVSGHLGNIQTYKDKPVYVYCSHSQRSRRVSKMLADSGFRQVININGGMTMLNNMKYAGLNCQQSLYETKNAYQLISPIELCSRINDKELFILDIRRDSAFEGISSREQDNAYGKINSAIHIPLSTLKNGALNIPADKTVVIMDDQGRESPEAAKFLLGKGYKKLAILFGGIENFASTNPAELSCKNQVLIRKNAYQLMTDEEFNQMATQNSDLLILDARTSAEFKNESKDYWRNIGQLKNAVNIPSQDIEKRYTEIESYKHKPIILYGFSGSPEPFYSARFLADHGFTKVFVLMGGIFHLRWAAANAKNHESLNNWVVNVPADNL